MGSLTVNKPVPVPPLPAAFVATVTLLLANNVVSVETLSMEVASAIAVRVRLGDVPVLVTPPSVPLEIVRSVGSSNNSPALPLVASVFTVPSKFNTVLPDVSTKPPEPEIAPPRAEMSP